MENKSNKEQITKGLDFILKFETNRRELNMTAYFQFMTQMTGAKFDWCRSCDAATKSTHESFTQFIFKKMAEFPEMIIPLPELKGTYNTDYYKKTLPIMSFTMLENNLVQLRKKMAQKPNNLEELKYNYDTIRQYKLDKLSYFSTILTLNEVEIVPETELDSPEVEANVSQIEDESNETEESKEITRRNSAVNKEELVEMKALGKSNAECAEHFGVSKQAIGKLLKTL